MKTSAVEVYIYGKYNFVTNPGDDGDDITNDDLKLQPQRRSFITGCHVEKQSKNGNKFEDSGGRILSANTLVNGGKSNKAFKIKYD